MIMNRHEHKSPGADRVTMDYTMEHLVSHVAGFYWLGKNGQGLDLARLPPASFSSLPPDVAFLARNTAGGLFRFKASTTGIGIEINMEKSRPYEKFSRAGQCGLDLYADGTYVHTFIPPRDGYFLDWFTLSDTAHDREFTLYLPTYAGLQLVSIGVDGTIGAPTPRAIKKPVVFYGSSITQGAYASRPGLAYPSIIGRELDTDIINLGFSGNGKGQPEVIDLVSDIDASCFVMDWGANLSAEPEEGLIEQRYQPFVDLIRQKHPEVPILFNGLQYFNPDPSDHRLQRRCDRIRKHIQAVFDSEVQKGNNRVAYIDGFDIIGPGDLDCTVDGTHANDLGFRRYVDAMVPVLRKLLGA